MTSSNSKASCHKIGYIESEVRSRTVGRPSPSGWLKVHCPNTAKHKHNDRKPSGSYNLATGFYRCYGCGLSGFANDRDRPDWNKRQARYYSNKVSVVRVGSGKSKNVWQENTNSSEKPKPYNFETLHSSLRRIYIVEGEKDADRVVEELDHKSEAVLTSIQGSDSAAKTNWAPVKNLLQANETNCEVVFIPDRDDSGERYIEAVARLLKLECMRIIRLGGSDRNDGYDVEQWLNDGHEWHELPHGIVKKLTPANTTPIRDYTDLFGYHEIKQLKWLAPDMIPAGKLTLIAGRSGIGKSTAALYIAAEISNKRQPFNNGNLDELFEPKVLIYSSEDDWNDTIAVRLQMMTAKMENIAPLFCQTDPERSFSWALRHDINDSSPPSDLEVLQKRVAENPPTLLIIDPFIDIVSGGNSNDAATVRESIERKLIPILTAGCTVLGIHHERKDARKDDLLVDRVLGSQAWGAVSRSVISMQALPKHKALGLGKKTKPRKSPDGKFTIKDMDLNTNSQIMGVIALSKANLAHVDGGFHYELPSNVPTEQKQTSSFIKFVLNPSKIKNRTAEELVQIYNPVAPEEEPENAVNRKAKTDMAREISAVNRAEAAIRELFEDTDVIEMPKLLNQVMEIGSVGERNARAAIRRSTDSKREGDIYFRVLKKEEKTNEDEISLFN